MKMMVWRDRSGMVHMTHYVEWYPCDADILDMVTMELSEEFVAKFRKAQDEWTVIQDKLYRHHRAKVAGEVCSVCDDMAFADIYFTKNGPVFYCAKHLPPRD
jgi:hypothetical protein